VAALVHGLAARGSPAQAPSFGAGPFPLAKLFAPIADALGPGAAHVAAVALLLGAAAFVMFAAFRLTANRPVAVCAGLIFAAHPLAVAAAASPVALREAVAGLLGAVLCFLHARPRWRSSRFPNRPASPLTRPVLLVLAVAILTVPSAWAWPLGLIVMDLVFDRASGGEAGERRWSAYLPYAALGALGLAALIVFGDGTQGAAGGFAAAGLVRRVAALALPPAAAGDALVATVLAAFLILAGLGAFLLDIGAGVGNRRSVVRFVGFGTAWALVALVPAAILAPHSSHTNVLFALIGAAIAFAALLWRAAGAAKQLQALPVAPVVHWNDVRASAGLADPPSLAHVPAPQRIEPSAPLRDAAPGATEAPARLSPALEAALARMHERRDGAAPADAASATAGAVDDPAFESHVLPRVPLAGHCIEIGDQGSFYTGALAARARRFTLIVGGAADVESLRRQLDGVAGAQVLALGARSLPETVSGVDFIVLWRCSQTSTIAALARLAPEIARALGPRGSGVLATTAPDEARGVLESAGLRASALATGSGGTTYLTFTRSSP
jgi:hypothetical protein